jgi:hypothetical protein
MEGMTTTPQLKEEDSLVLFMATLGWTYGKYDDQCFHVFDSSGNNTMTIATARQLQALITAQVRAAEKKVLPEQLRLAYEIRIDELQSQLKTVKDFANLLAELSNQEGEV